MTKHDLRFRLAGFPVRVHPGFWLVTGLLALSGGSQISWALIWVAVILVSIVIHELGHALAFRRYEWGSHIVLYAFGGLAVPEPRVGSRQLSWRETIVVSLAGPFAGFAFAAVVLAGVLVSGFGVQIAGLSIGSATPLPNPELQVAVFYLLFVNILWGLVNLVPVQPLDGGQAALAYLGHKSKSRGQERALWLSVLAGGAVAVVGVIALQSPFMALLFGYLAFQSYGALKRVHTNPSLSAWMREERGLRAQRRARKKRADATRAAEAMDERDAQLEREDSGDGRAAIAQEADALLGTLMSEIRQGRGSKRDDEDS